MPKLRIGPYEAVPVDGPSTRRWWESTDGDGRPVLLRAASAGDGRDVVIEAVALDRADHPHVVEVVEVFHDDEHTPVVVTAGIPAVRLDRWLSERGTISRGEAVTLVVPLASALAHLEARGLAPLAIEPHDIGIDSRGAPVLLGLSGPASARPQAGDPSPAAGDLRRLVADRLEGSSWSASPPTTVDELLEWAHDLGEPTPLPTVFAPDERAGATAPGDAVERVLPAWTRILPESELVERALEWRATRSSTTILDRVRAVRPRFRVMAGLCALSLVGAAVLLPGGSDTATPSAASDRTPAPADGSAGPSPDPEVAEGSLSPQREASSPSVEPPPPSETLVRGDDAAAATAVLLEARVGCLRDVTVSCLSAVDHAGSPLAVADAAALADPGVVETLVLPIRLGDEQQRLGESVLFEAFTAHDEPASVLVVRTEAGWRLREIEARR